jgi:uncharacterized lipoprotein YajG
MTTACLKKIAIAIGISILAGCSQPLNIQSIEGTWKPVSKAYLALGNLTISDNAITWSSGQKASFSIVKQDRYDIILELTGTDYKYLKLTPKDNLQDLEKEDLRVTFYGASQGLDDKNAPEAIYTRH